MMNKHKKYIEVEKIVIKTIYKYNASKILDGWITNLYNASTACIIEILHD